MNNPYRTAEPTENVYQKISQAFKEKSQLQSFIKEKIKLWEAELKKVWDSNIISVPIRDKTSLWFNGTSLMIFYDTQMVAFLSDYPQAAHILNQKDSFNQEFLKAILKQNEILKGSDTI